MTINKIIHLKGSHETITPCGKSFEFHVILGSENLKEVTCKRCRITNWFKDEKSRKNKNAKINH